MRVQPDDDPISTIEAVARPGVSDRVSGVWEHGLVHLGVPSYRACDSAWQAAYAAMPPPARAMLDASPVLNTHTEFVRDNRSQTMRLLFTSPRGSLSCLFRALVLHGRCNALDEADGVTPFVDRPDLAHQDAALLSVMHGARTTSHALRRPVMHANCTIASTGVQATVFPCRARATPRLRALPHGDDATHGDDARPIFLRQVRDGRVEHSGRRACVDARRPTPTALLSGGKAGLTDADLRAQRLACSRDDSVAGSYASRDAMPDECRRLCGVNDLAPLYDCGGYGTRYDRVSRQWKCTLWTAAAPTEVYVSVDGACYHKKPARAHFNAGGVLQLSSEPVDDAARVGQAFAFVDLPDVRGEVELVLRYPNRSWSVEDRTVAVAGAGFMCDNIHLTTPQPRCSNSSASNYGDPPPPPPLPSPASPPPRAPDHHRFFTLSRGQPCEDHTGGRRARVRRGRRAGGRQYPVAGCSRGGLLRPARAHVVAFAKPRGLRLRSQRSQDPLLSALALDATERVPGRGLYARVCIGSVKYLFPSPPPPPY